MRKTLFILLFLAVVFLVSSCQRKAIQTANAQKEIPKDWQKIETDYFSFSIPQTMKKNDVQGIDSFVMQFESNEITLDIEYGMYSTDLSYGSQHYESQKEVIEIDGEKTVIVSLDYNKPILSSSGVVNAARPTKVEKVEKNHVVGINLPHKNEVISLEDSPAISFIAKSKTLEAQETAKTIFYSIKFKYQ